MTATAPFGPLELLERTVKEGLAVTSYSSTADLFLKDMLNSKLVLQEDFEQLPEQVRDAIGKCVGMSRLLAMLVEHGLLTDYQAARIESGKTYGLILGNYRVLDRLGAGGMGVVFKAEHVEMRRPVAIKVLSASSGDDSRIQQRFRTEIRAVAQLQHPNIVAAMDAGTLSAPDGPTLHYFVMEYVAGQDLEEFVNAAGPLSPVKACDIIHQMAAALAEASKHNLVHRDIKPSNIRLTPDGQAKLLDFGLARDTNRRITAPGTMLGTVDYMAPEQFSDAGAVDIRADIYALGGTLYWCLTGKIPFLHKGTIIQDVTSRKDQKPPSLRALRPEIPASLDAVVSRMMAPLPEDRYATPQEVMQAMVAFLKPEMRDGIFPGQKRPSAQEVSQEANRKQRILIVDDEPSIRALCRAVFEGKDWPECDEAADGAVFQGHIAGGADQVGLLQPHGAQVGGIVGEADIGPVQVHRVDTGRQRLADREAVVDLLQHEAREHGQDLQLDVVAELVARVHEAGIDQLEGVIGGPHPLIRRIVLGRRAAGGGGMGDAVVADQHAAAG